uniref:3-beta hydroxysteroid dehydrogenase/isomerase domain-containing protein n=1 Tax=Strigamia maritima TaxID=126957 RepID=T1J625_STRMM
MTKATTVLVTGANGFYGQFIVKLLHEKDDEVTEIRTFDTTPFVKNLDYTETKEVRSIVGDICNFSTLLNACEKVDCVIHAASVIDFSPNPDVKAMFQNNVKGTENIIEACLQAKVDQLVYTSTVDVVVGKQRLAYAREMQVDIPENPLFPAYAKSKYEAEAKVLQANGKIHKDGDGKLHTLALRSVATYGENDPYYVTNCLKNAANTRGVLVRLGSGREFMQQMYVGNVAWAHLVARRALKEHPEKTGGLPYFITDDTLPCNIFDFVEPFLLSRGFRLSDTRIPFWVIWILYIMQQIVLALLSPVYKPSNPMIPIQQVYYACNTYVVNRKRASEILKYSPIYQSKDAMAGAAKYYSQVKL